MRRSSILLFSLLLCVFALMGSCDDRLCGCDPVPNQLNAQFLPQHWRLDEVAVQGQVVSQGSAIKDRYTLRFLADGTYQQTLLADGTQFAGTYKLDPGLATLQLTDHKGDARFYSVVQLSETVLRYGSPNKDGAFESYLFTKIP